MFCQAKLRPLAWWFCCEAGHLHVGSAQGNDKRKGKAVGLPAPPTTPGTAPVPGAVGSPCFQRPPGTWGSLHLSPTLGPDKLEDRHFLEEQANDTAGRRSPQRLL